MIFDEAVITELETQARLALTAPERARLTEDLTSILAYLSDLVALDLPQAPAAEPESRDHDLRADEVIPAPAAGAFLAAAPTARDGYLVVPRLRE